MKKKGNKEKVLLATHDNRIRILLIGPVAKTTKDVGGTTVSFEMLARQLVIKPNIDARILAFPGRRDSSLIRALRLIILFIRAIRHVPSTDVVSIHASNGLPFLGALIWCLTRLLHKRLILRQFGGHDYISSSLLTQQLLKWLIRRSDLVLLQTLGQLNASRTWMQCQKRWYPNSRPAYSRHRPIPDHCDRFIYIGHVRPCKGIFELFAATEKANLPCPVDVYGPMMEGLGQSDFDGRHHVRYKGILSAEQVMPTMEQYDALIMPTYWPSEGYPGVILEAFHAGLPVICSRWRFLPELVDDSCGFLVPPRDANQLSQAMSDLVAMPERYQQFCRGAQARAQLFDAEFWGDRFVSFCEALRNGAELPKEVSQAAP